MHAGQAAEAERAVGGEMSETFWETSGIGLWLLHGDGPEFLKYIGVKRIEWRSSEERICGYCGAVLSRDEIKCPNCGSSQEPLSENNLGRAVVTLFGPLPDAACVFHLPTGTDLELHYQCCGPREYYESNEGGFRFVGCRPFQKWIDELAASGPFETATVYLYVKVECEVELHTEPMEWRGGSNG
jgi:hypothetical protein